MNDSQSRLQSDIVSNTPGNPVNNIPVAKIGYTQDNSIITRQYVTLQHPSNNSTATHYAMTQHSQNNDVAMHYVTVQGSQYSNSSEHNVKEQHSVALLDIPNGKNTVTATSSHSGVINKFGHNADLAYYIDNENYKERRTYIKDLMDEKTMDNKIPAASGKPIKDTVLEKDASALLQYNDEMVNRTKITDDLRSALQQATLMEVGSGTTGSTVYMTSQNSRSSSQSSGYHGSQLITQLQNRANVSGKQASDRKYFSCQFVEPI